MVVEGTKEVLEARKVWEAESIGPTNSWGVLAIVGVGTVPILKVRDASIFDRLAGVKDLDHSYAWGLFKQSAEPVAEYMSLGLDIEWELDPPLNIKLFFPVSEFWPVLQMIYDTGSIILAPEGKLKETDNKHVWVDVSSPKLLAVTLTAVGHSPTPGGDSIA